MYRPRSSRVFFFLQRCPLSGCAEANAWRYRELPMPVDKLTLEATVDGPPSKESIELINFENNVSNYNSTRFVCTISRFCNYFFITSASTGFLISTPAITTRGRGEVFLAARRRARPCSRPRRRTWSCSSPPRPPPTSPRWPLRSFDTFDVLFFIVRYVTQNIVLSYL